MKEPWFYVLIFHEFMLGFKIKNVILTPKNCHNKQIMAVK